MVLPLSPSTQNLYKGGGAIYFAARDADGNPMGLVHLGNGPVFGGQPQVTYDEHRSSLTAAFEKDIEVADEIGMTYKGEFEEYSAHNLNLAALGDGVHAVSQASGSGIEADPITVDVLDAWYKTGSKGITVESLVDEESTEYDEGADKDFIVDAERGWIKPLSTGDIEVGMELTATITRTAWAAEEIRPLTNPTVEGYLHFLGNPAKGPLIEIEAWLVRLTVSGEFPLITQNYGKIPFEFEVLSDRENHPETPFGRVRLTQAA